MKPDTLSEWVLIGARLFEQSPERYQEIVDSLKEAADAQDLIADHDDQLLLRDRRPSKVYRA